jgi:hypothetical protein
MPLQRGIKSLGFPRCRGRLIGESAGHHDVKLKPEELRRIIIWLDANSDFFGAYEDPRAQARGELLRPKLQ